VKYRFKVPSIAEIILWTLIVGYLSLFGSIIADLNYHFTEFVTNVFAYSNEQHQSSFKISAQTRIKYSDFKIDYVDSQFVDKVKDHESYDKKSDTNYTQKESIQDWTSKFVDLMLDSIFSVSRMFTALGLSFVAAIVVGIAAARISLASRIVIPIVDVLQSIPILGFFPAANSLVIALFHGNAVGIEIAAIFLIFTSMAWNMIFSVYESVLSIPTELMETSYAYRANLFLRVRRLYIPASIPKLVYNGILSWASGWYFLTAAEIISLGSKTFTLPGLGSLLGKSVSAGEYAQAIAALSMLILIILVTDFFFWRPLESYANRFRYEYSTSLARVTKHTRLHLMLRPPGSRFTKLLLRNPAATSSLQLSDFFIRNPRPLISVQSNKVIEALSMIGHQIESKLFPTIQKWFDNKAILRMLRISALLLIISIILLVILLEHEFIHQTFLSFSKMYVSIGNDSRNAEILSLIPIALLLSYLRLVAAYLLTLAWTVPVAIKIARDPRFDRIMPMFQTLASIPAPAFFPFLIPIVNYVPGGFEFLSILLILTGMQWYMFFNLIGGVRSISGEIEETARAFRATRFHYLKRVLFPAIYPSFITGSITSWGGGWNSLVVAEFIVFGYRTYSVTGIGSLLDKAAYNTGNTLLIIIIVSAMMAVIVTINRLVWRRVYRRVIKKYGMGAQ
jgi:NitT/TauT family transport system permease protein